MRDSKDRKHIKASVIKNAKAKKTSDSRERRKKNKIVRELMVDVAPNLDIEVITGVVYTKYAGKVVMKTDADYLCEHGNDRNANCSECFNEQFAQSESMKDDLTPNDTLDMIEYEESLEDYHKMVDKEAEIKHLHPLKQLIKSIIG